ncbi:hypothetical protein PVK06_010470 [Gossypium arboreum]|uniref:Uncharacterized protein n=1 Tax=Gossypium arboreum TaxID=29729 RepID=A0ABR0Q6J2_GOSAR|nr:hypothetical protein PVK06_010470 [Gossypium arboreum]
MWVMRHGYGMEFVDMVPPSGEENWDVFTLVLSLPVIKSISTYKLSSDHDVDDFVGWGYDNKILTLEIIAFLSLRPFPLAAFFITTLLVSLMMFIFTIIDNALGSATFNPTDFLSCYAVGLKKDWSTLSMVVRFSLQATGGVVGVKTILGVLPREYKETIKGPLKVDM